VLLILILAWVACREWCLRDGQLGRADCRQSVLAAKWFPAAIQMVASNVKGLLTVGGEVPRLVGAWKLVSGKASVELVRIALVR
jgi:hypothetical protein